MADWLLSIIVSIIVWLLWNKILSKSRQKKLNQVTYVREADYTRTRYLFNMTRWKLEQKGLGDLMMTDYCFKTKVGSPKTTDIYTLQEQLQKILMEILTHIHMMPNVRLIVTQDPQRLDLKGAMGEYHNDYLNKQIRLLVSPDYTAEMIVAALCHECAHYFAYSYGISETTQDLNEGLTDTLTILLGFSDAVLKVNNNRQLPYLIQPEFQELRKMQQEYRKEKKAEQTAAKELDAARKQLCKNIEGAKTMIEQVRAMISVNKTPTKSKRHTRKDMEKLQKTLFELESGAFDDSLVRTEKAVKGDLSQVRAADDEVLEICSKLYLLMLTFQ